MGSSSSNTSGQTSATLAPYAPAASSLNGALGELGTMVNSGSSLNSGQSGALNQIIANSNGTPNYSSNINSGTYGLLNGGGAQNNDAAIRSTLGGLQGGIVGQTASGANIGGNPGLKAQLDAAAADTSNSINSSFAASGRDGSPGNSQAVARGVMTAEAPIIAGQYNTDTTNALNSANTLYGAGNNTYGLLNANQGAANTNFTNGVGTIGAGVTANNAAPAAALTAASAQWGIPVQQLQTLLSSIAPTAAQFGTQTGTSNSTTTTNPSLLSQASQFGSLFGSQGTSPMQGMANAGSGLLNGIGTLFG